MICIDALNDYIKDLRGDSTVKGTFIIVKNKEKALAIGPLKKFTVQVWFVSKESKINVLNLSTLQSTLNIDSENRTWNMLEKYLNKYIFTIIQSPLQLDCYVKGMCLNEETKEINIT